MKDLEKEINQQLKELEQRWEKGQKLFVQLNQQIARVRDELIAIKAQYEALNKLVKKSPDKLPMPTPTTVTKRNKK